MGSVTLWPISHNAFRYASQSFSQASPLDIVKYADSLQKWLAARSSHAHSNEIEGRHITRKSLDPKLLLFLIAAAD